MSKLGTSALNIPFATASVSRYNVLVSEISSGVGAEGSAQTMIRTAGTLKNLQVSVASNARTTPTDIRVRKNGANGNLVVTVSGPATGVPIEDTTHTDTVAAGDLIDFVTVTGTGTENLQVSHIIVDFVTTDGKGFTSYGRAGAYVQPEPATNFPVIGGGAIVASTATETNTQVLLRQGFIFSQMVVSVTQNTVNAISTLRFRKNGGNGNQVVSIGSTATGFLFDNTNTDVCSATDPVNFQLTTTDVTGSQTMTIRNFALIYNEINPVSQTNIHRYSLLQNAEEDNIRRYSLRQNTEKLNIRRYSLLSLLDIPTIRRYSLRQLVSPQSIRRYSSRQLVDALNKRRYTIAQYLNAQNIRRYTLRQYLEMQNIRRYSLRQLVMGIQTIRRYNLLQLVSKQSIRRYSLRQYLDKLNIRLYGLRQVAQATSIRVYDVAAAIGIVAAQSIRRYSIYEYVSAPKIRRYNIFEQISVQSIRLYNVLEPTILVTAENIRRYDLKEFISAQTIRRYNVVEFGKKLYSMLGAGGKVELEQAAKILQDFIRGGYPQ